MNVTVLWNKLHPHNKKETKDIVQEIIAYYLESFLKTRPPKRTTQKKASLEKHSIVRGPTMKCYNTSCNKRTDRYCKLCKKAVCKTHTSQHESGK